MNIVVMQERHLAALADIERACFHAPWSADMLREELGKGIFLVAEQDILPMWPCRPTSGGRESRGR